MYASIYLYIDQVQNKIRLTKKNVRGFLRAEKEAWKKPVLIDQQGNNGPSSFGPLGEGGSSSP